MAENRMELFIETLTGTAFELSCSPLETIVSIKAKIQYSEGIPVSQQHLIWRSQELNDDLCLQDYRINDGATLKLVLGMRGGPINTRQVSGTKKFKDLADYVERSSDSGGRPFTVLVFHDGDKVHMYTLMEKGECPHSRTISETSSITSLRNIEDLDKDVTKENEATREKIAQLQERLKSLNISRPKKVSSKSIHPQKISVQRNTPLERHSEEFHLPPLHRIHPHFATPKASVSWTPSTLLPSRKSMKRECLAKPAALDLMASNMSAYLVTPKDADASCSTYLPAITTKTLRKTMHKTKAVSPTLQGSIKKYDPSCLHNAHKRHSVSSSKAICVRRMVRWTHKDRPQTSPEKSTDLVKWGHTLAKSIEDLGSVLTVSRNQKVEPVSFEAVSAALSNAERVLPDEKDSNVNGCDVSPGRSETKLPLIKAKKKSYQRCSQCSKKTGLATSYTCRCGRNFCASHRYAELHQCTYDYKTEGRRVLQLNNPVIAASKLPKI